MKAAIEFFPEFNWAVPKSFSVPLRDCRFEQGDRLYDTAEAYEGTWSHAQRHLKYSIEVLLPPRGQGVQKSDKDSASTFAANWLAPVELVLTLHKENVSRRIKTTQGKLYTVLWHGSVLLLDEPNFEPSLPQKTLSLAYDSQRVIGHFRDSVPDKNACSFFLTPFDETNDIFVSKTNLIQQALAQTCPFEFYKERPEIIYNRTEEFAPTLYVGCYVIKSTDRKQIEAAFKKALYVPVKNKITNRENWNLEKHGLLVEVGI